MEGSELLIALSSFATAFLGVLAAFTVYASLYLLSAVRRLESIVGSASPGTGMVAIAGFRDLEELARSLGCEEVGLLSSDGLPLEVYPRGGLIERYASLLAGLGSGARGVEGVKRLELVMDGLVVAVYRVGLGDEEVYAAFAMKPWAPRPLEASLLSAVSKYLRSKCQ
ncbi:MAG: hypothetical protein DRJ96_10000 [Thermoprotei archaeon]|nr:hypothetical protein [Thermoproteales archaeon]RLE93560.1 MAG: hypothetical protein DRJ96_10000 [Thermoprotei archaeon]